MHKRQEGDGEKDTRLVLIIDEGAVPVLEGLGMQPYFWMGRAAIKLLGAKSANVGGTVMETEDAAKDGE